MTIPDKHGNNLRIGDRVRHSLGLGTVEGFNEERNGHDVCVRWDYSGRVGLPGSRDLTLVINGLDIMLEIAFPEAENSG